MAFAFDTLSYANHLKKAGVDAVQAEAHAEAAREFIMAELVTKADLINTTTMIDQRITAAVQSMTIRLGTIVAAGIAIVVAISRLWT